MGMDFRYAGSASYPRFNDEMKKIVELFGGEMTSKRKPQEECTIVEYFMEEPLEYKMPEGTPDYFIKFVNDPYAEDFTVKETKEIFEFIKPKLEEVRVISSQIVSELETLVENEEPWDIW